MSGFNVIKDEPFGVSICKECDDALDSFIDIYIDDGDTPSPFKDINDAKLFAEIIVKLLEVVI